MGYKVSSKRPAKLGGTNIGRVDIKQDYIILGTIYRLKILYID